MKKWIIGCSVMALAASASAALVQWGGDYVTANQNADIVDTYTTGSGYQSPATGYTGPGFYGAVDAKNFRLDDKGANDLIRINKKNASSDGMVVFDGFNSTISELSINAKANFGTNTDVSATFFIIQDASAATDADGWYISQDLGSGTINDSYLTADLTWYDFTPKNAGSVTIGTTAQTIDFDAATFDHAGFYVNMNVTDATGWTGMDISSFEAIPEPATIGLLGVAAGALMFIRRRFMI